MHKQNHYICAPLVRFKAYSCFYEVGLLSDSLLPVTSVVDPVMEEEIKAMLVDV